MRISAAADAGRSWRAAAVRRCMRASKRSARSRSASTSSRNCFHLGLGNQVAAFLDAGNRRCHVPGAEPTRAPGRTHAAIRARAEADHIAEGAREDLVDIGLEARRQTFEAARQFGIAGDLDLARWNRRLAIAAQTGESKAEQAGRCGLDAQLAVTGKGRTDDQTLPVDSESHGQTGALEFDAEGTPIECAECVARLGIQAEGVIERRFRPRPSTLSTGLGARWGWISVVVIGAF